MGLAARACAGEPVIRKLPGPEGSPGITCTVYGPNGSAKGKPGLVVHLYGSGGSHRKGHYNVGRSPYDEFRRLLAERGYWLVVPELGARHWMNETASAQLDSVIGAMVDIEGVDAGHVHLFGTSMGAGSSLIYAMRHPENIKSVVAIFPMTDSPPQFEDYFTSDFYRKHPKWRCYDRDGTPVMRMSFAVPEVRGHLVDIMREVVTRYRPDGIEIVYFRGLPLILWEDAFCEQFQNRFGADAKQVPEDDPRLFDLRCEILTSFMGEIRTMLDEVQKSRSRSERYALSASVVHTRDDNRRHGIDVERWVKEGLVDQIGVFPWAFHASRKPMDLEWFAEITKGTGVELYPVTIGWKQRSAQRTLSQALDHYARGASGILVWDPNPVGFYSPDGGYSAAHAGSYFRPREIYWPVISRLGHLKEIRSRLEESKPAPTHIPLKRYGDYWFGRLRGPTSRRCRQSTARALCTRQRSIPRSFAIRRRP